ncbi:MAG: methyltransferase family protein [Candidatus Bathycorpusculaceae bacterium]
MPKNHKLITWGSYTLHVPSYVLGTFFLWPNVFTLFPLMVIPGYVQVTFAEEKLLVQRFGREYIEYQKRTGRFIPRLSKQEKNC